MLGPEWAKCLIFSILANLAGHRSPHIPQTGQQATAYDLTQRLIRLFCKGNLMGSVSGLIILALMLSGATTERRPITLLQAAEIAERTTRGKIMEAEHDWGRHGPGFELDVVTPQGLRRVLIDSAGRIQRNDRVRFGDIWNRVSDREARSRINRARSLSSLLAALEQRSGGTAVDASFEVEGGRSLYEVELVTSIGRTTIYLDALTGGQVVHVPDD